MGPDAAANLTGQGSRRGEWECMECGYIEEGVKSESPRVCPNCGAPTQALEFFPFGDDDADDGNGAASKNGICEDEDEELG